MAPSVQQLPEETPVVSTEKVVPVVVKPTEESPKVKRQIDLEGGKTDAKVCIPQQGHQRNKIDPLQYPQYLPTWNHGQKYPPLEPFNYIEHGRDADPTFKDLLPEGSKIQKLTPSIGSEVTGVQLSKLSPAGRDQLALLV